MIDERVADFVAFKAKHGHCNAPQNPSSENKSPSSWCNAMRVSYKQIREGKTPAFPLSQDQISRLEALAFEWVRKTAVFEKRLVGLAAYKAKHGHCNFPNILSSDYKTLGNWCSHMRSSYKQKQGGKTPGSLLLQDQIGRLKALGFE